MFNPQNVETTNPAGSWGFVPKHSSEFLFASLADPEQTHLALNFDRTLESLMWAIEDTDYAFEAYWLPWTLAAETNYTGLGDQECLRKQKESRRKQPGLLVFHRKAEPDHFLFVWLVGETPTSGVDRSMLSNAVAYSRIIDPDLHTFRFVGPNFSGSLYSLTRQVKDIVSGIQGGVFQFVSGAVTNFPAINAFRKVLDKDKSGTFESSIENDSEASTLFFNYVRTQLTGPLLEGLGYDETAILSEDETVYGDLGLAPQLSPPKDSHSWMMLRYPREIARLRNSYHEDSPASSAASSSRQSATDGGAVASRDSAAHRSEVPADSIMDFSGQQSPLSQQAVLLTISSTLRRERASYTGIIATDVLDSVFLAHFLRSADPDSRLFTIDADLLFVREGDTEPLAGLLSVTNYPLFSRNQHWTQGELKPDHMPRRVQFASRYAEGIYNACRRLIAPRPAGGSNPQMYDTYLEYEWPSDRSREMPPLWLTVVGRDGYWPVALLERDANKAANIGSKSTVTDFTEPGNQNAGSASSKQSASGDPPEKFHPEEPSRGWRLLFVCACLFCFAHVFYMFNILRWQPGNPPKQGKLVRGFQALTFGLHHLFTVYPDDHRPSDQERPFLLTATLSLFSSLLLFSFPLFPFLSHPRFLCYFITAAICLISLLAVAASLMRGKVVYLRVVLLAWLLSIPFLAGWIWLIVRGKYHSGEFFAYRALYLGNGVSPEIPIVLLAVVFYGWAWMQLHREADVRVRRGVRPSKQNQPWPDDFSAPIKKTDDAIEKILAPQLWVPALACLILWFLVLWPPESLRTFEWWLYDVLYWAILTAVYWCIALVTVQFIRCWRQLRKLLDALERHPIRHAFSRLNKEISWIPLVSSTPARSLVVSTRSLDCLKALHSQILDIGRHDIEIERVLAPAGTGLGEAFTAMQCKLSEGQDFNPDYQAFQHQLDQITRHTIEELKVSGWERGHSESIANEVQRTQQHPPLWDREKIRILQEEFIALRLLMYIRYVLRQLRNWIGFIIGGFIISTISMNSYPFQAHRWIGLASLITLAAIGAGIVLVFAEMDRDAILSRITDTKANELGTTFFIRLARFGALPLITVLAAQFPTVNRVLFFWIKPAFEALK